MRFKKIVIKIFLFTLVFGFISAGTAFADSFFISGSVKDSSGNAIVGATVSVNDANSDNTTTDSSGNYTLVIPSGVYNVQASPPSGSNFSPAIYIGRTISSNTVINFILVPATSTVSLSGHVYDANGNPLTNQQVSLLVGTSYKANTFTDASGSYSLQAVAGTYNVLVQATGANQNSNPYVPQLYTLQAS